jgi:hypothetical protein
MGLKSSLHFAHRFRKTNMPLGDSNVQSLTTTGQQIGKLETKEGGKL